MAIEGILEFYEVLHDVTKRLSDDTPVFIEFEGVKYRVDDIVVEDEGVIIMPDEILE